MANYEATRYDWDGEYLANVQGISTGTILPWSSNAIPSGFFECNGQAVSRTTYAALFAIISTTYGIGDGTTTFNVPDLTDKTIVNKSNNKSLAQTMGANTVPRTGNITGSSGNTQLTSAQMPSHTHSGVLRVNSSNQGGEGNQTNFAQSTVTSQSTGGDQSHSHNLSGNLVGGADSVLQPYLVLIYIIKN